MTLRAIVGLVVLHAFFLGVGAALLWGLRGWRVWTDFVRLAGLAYLLGVAGVVTVLTLAIVVGIPFGPPLIVGSGAAIVAGSLAAARWRKRPRPALHPRGWRLPTPSLLSAGFIAALVLYFEASFRSERLAELYDWDAWFTWTLKGKALYHFGGLEEWIFGGAAYSGGVYTGYPPGFSVLQAASFHAMGVDDVVTQNLNYWFFTLGFAAAVAGLLATRVRGLILLPALLLMLVLPGLTGIPVPGGAERPLAFFIATAALLVFLWLDERKSWQLATAAILLAGAFLTKREGLLLGACVVFAAGVATWADRRWAWPRLAALGTAAFALALPWRVWVAAKGYRSDAPEAGFLGFLDDYDRALDSLWLAVRAMFGYDLWLVLPGVAILAAALAFLAGARKGAVFTLAFVGVTLAANAWVTLTNPVTISLDYSLNPATRFMVTPLLVVAAVLPLLLERAWSGANGRPDATTRVTAWSTRFLVPWTIVLAALLLYPASMAVGYSGFRLPGGLPPFPNREECVRAPADGEPVRLVFGYEHSYVDANELRDRARQAGFARTGVARDGCGRLRIFVDNVPSIPAGEELAVQARAAGLEPSLEAGRTTDASAG
jgi:4-amino-4-deoxy-L-arabinose transferase-like glycosyltransferase